MPTVWHKRIQCHNEADGLGAFNVFLYPFLKKIVTPFVVSSPNHERGSALHALCGRPSDRRKTNGGECCTGYSIEVQALKGFDTQKTGHGYAVYAWGLYGKSTIALSDRAAAACEPPRSRGPGQPGSNALPVVHPGLHAAHGDAGQPACTIFIRTRAGRSAAQVSA